MQRRDFLRISGLGLIAAVPAQAAMATDARFINAADFGASGKGAADDTVALQEAIDRALAEGRSCFIPAGIYKISRPLIIGDPASKVNHQAFTLFGSGKATPQGGIGGTSIVLTTTGNRAIVQFEKNAWRHCAIRDIGLECSQQGGANYGVLFNSTEFSGHTLDNIGVRRTKTAFGILAGTGGNGEFTIFNDCNASNVSTFFYTNAGQAFVQYFHHCGCFLSAGGTYFHLDLASGGGGINVVDFNATGEQKNGTASNTTFIKNSNSNSCMNVLGGRIEHLTRLYESIGGTTNLHVTAAITGMEILVDAVPSDSADAKQAFINVAMAPDILSIDSCSFGGVSGREAIDVANASASILFRGCYFSDFMRMPRLISTFDNEYTETVFDQCRATVPIPRGDGERPGNRPFPLERRDRDVGASLGRRAAFSENAWVSSGRPINLLTHPQLTVRNGTSVKAEFPWVHFGESAHINAYDWNHEGHRSQNPSPWAKVIELPPRSGIYQDILAVDLSSQDGAYIYNGVAFHRVTYEAMLTRLIGHGSIKIALADSVGGAVYDEVQFKSSGDSSYARSIALVANVARKAKPSYVRLRIENTSLSWVTIEFAWQLAADNYEPAFAPSAAAPTLFEDRWGMSSESGRFWSRLSLPYKPDAYGSESRRPLNDLQSDIYLSKSTEKLTYFANDRWWAAPRVTSALTFPSVGRWAQGDIVYNAAPTAGGVVGWVQVTPGHVAAEHAWIARHQYTAGTRVYRADAVYSCSRSGTSSTSGPLGESDTIEDGSCAWAYAGQLAPAACRDAWSPAAHALGDQVHRSGNVYVCVGSGISGSNGPAGTGADIPDGDVKWRFLGRLARFKSFGKIDAE